MTAYFLIATSVVYVLLYADSAFACATCSLDRGSAGQSLMLIVLLVAPFVVGMVGVFVMLRLLREEH